MVIKNTDPPDNDDIKSIFLEEHEQNPKKYISYIGDFKISKEEKKYIMTMFDLKDKPIYYEREKFHGKSFKDVMLNNSLICFFNINNESDREYLKYSLDEVKKESHIILCYKRKDEKWIKQLKPYSMVQIKKDLLTKTKLKFKDGFIYAPVIITKPTGFFKRVFSFLMFWKKTQTNINIE